MKRYYCVAVAVLLLLVVLCVGCDNSGDKTTTNTNPAANTTDSVKIPDGFVKLDYGNNNYPYSIGFAGTNVVDGVLEASFYVIKLSANSDSFHGFNAVFKDNLGESYNSGLITNFYFDSVSGMLPKGFTYKVRSLTNVPAKAVDHIVSCQVYYKDVFPVVYDLTKTPDDYFIKFGQEVEIDSLAFTPITIEETENKINITVSVRNKVYTDKRVSFRFFVQTLDGEVFTGKESEIYTVPGTESNDFVLEAETPMSNVRAYIIAPRESSFGTIIVSPE